MDTFRIWMEGPAITPISPSGAGLSVGSNPLYPPRVALCAHADWRREDGSTVAYCAHGCSQIEVRKGEKCPTKGRKRYRGKICTCFDPTKKAFSGILQAAIKAESEKRDQP